MVLQAERTHDATRINGVFDSLTNEHDYVVVPVTAGRMRIVEGSKESLADLASGVAYFRHAGVEHDVFNGGDRELIFVEVELIS